MEKRASEACAGFEGNRNWPKPIRGAEGFDAFTAGA